ncbi:MAG: hypothetical protein JO060_08765, partial [Candidatus Eremiobacteraeota bacterium]|nr:hypothetical protein [Candidatus Eremiobacteraeota bacterium]
MSGADAGTLVVLAALIGGILGYSLPRRSRLATANGTVSVQEGVEERDARFEELLQAITVGIIVLDARGYVTSLNAAAGTIFAIR